MSLENSNWYFVQAFKSGSYGVGYTIAFADNMAQAKAKALKWARSKGFNGDIKLYHKNYKRDARNMVEVGNYI